MVNSKKILLSLGLVFSGLIALWLVTFGTVSNDVLAPALEISGAEAMDKVKNLSEVRKFVGDLDRAGSKAKFNVEDGGDTWNVQVFEIVEQGENSHTATFNWYHVAKKTGTIINEFNLESK